jgi:hypothetical protein
MNPSKMSPDDPKLTAYALGELDGEESALVAKAIRDDAAALAAVEEIQSLAGQLESALADEPIEPRVPAEIEVPAAAPAKIIRFPFYAVSGLAAACVAVVLVLRPAAVKERPAALPTSSEVAATAPAALPAPAVSSTPEVAPVVSPVVVENGEEVVAVDVAKARRVPSDSLPDINPSPAIEGGLKLGRTVAAVDSQADASFVDEYAIDLTAFEVESKLPKVEVGGKIQIPLADLSGATKPAQEFKLATSTFSQPKKETPVTSVASYEKLLNWAQTKDAKEDPKTAVAARADESDETAKKVKAAVE